MKDSVLLPSILKAYIDCHTIANQDKSPMDLFIEYLDLTKDYTMEYSTKKPKYRVGENIDSYGVLGGKKWNFQLEVKEITKPIVSKKVATKMKERELINKIISVMKNKGVTEEKRQKVLNSIVLPQMFDIDNRECKEVFQKNLSSWKIIYKIVKYDCQ